ncbi:MAG: acylphosphatase [Candidatus Kariarchaeaceae archaeon]|jgi:acylphosphatase
MSEVRKRVELHITGQVQGIFFRVNAKELASSLSIVGWVKNNPDGSVSILAEGPSDLVNDFIDWCKKGPSMAKVKSVDITEKKPNDEFTKFEIK